MRWRNWAKMSGSELWGKWRETFTSDDEAVATAVFIVNRQVKDKARSTRRIFYHIKDQFLARMETRGKPVRIERQECRACYGTDPLCDRCDGTGVWRSRWLYVLKFDLGGQQYCFHSYQCPKVLEEGFGDDLEAYGGQFSDAELKEMALPMSGLLRMLRYVSAVVWERGEQPPLPPRPTKPEVDIRHYWVTQAE